MVAVERKLELPAEDAGVAEIRRISTLLEISQALADTLRLPASLRKVVKVLRRHPSVQRCCILIRAEECGDDLIIESEEEGEQAVDLLQAAQRVVSRVLESGKPVVIPRESREPFLQPSSSGRHRKGAADRSMLCIPISVNGRVGGCLLVRLYYRRDRNYERAQKFLGVVTSLISQAVQISRLVEAEKRALLEENLHLREELKERYDFSNIVGTSGAIQQVYKQVSQVARANTTVLIRGESGTGKELIAHAIHYNSLRSSNSFVRVSCAALPETLIESELFGHEKGAFTGAEKVKKGRFELAEGGTLFLDEIGELQTSLQVKLLRVLQEKEFERLGGTQTHRADVRLIAATNKDLEQAIQQGKFRDDLYYRLNVFTICVPPLRDRKSDILLLADHFLEKYSRRHSKNIKRISTPAIDMLTAYHWPGNVRELENAIERAVLVCEGHVVHGFHLPPTLQTAEASGTTVRINLQEAVSTYEKELILDSLKSSRGNRARAARLLSTTERIIGYKIRKYGINCDRFRVNSGAVG